MTHVRLFLVVVGLVLTSACGVSEDSAPRDLPEDERELSFDETAAQVAATGANRMYLIGPGEQRLLRSVQREANTPVELMNALLLGPNESEIQAEFDTAIPATTVLNDADPRAEVLTVDLTSDIDELDTQTLMLAIAQIVYTATEIDNVEAVQIVVDGEPLTAPLPDGRTSTGPLRTYDYPNTVQTSQPEFPAAALTSS